MSPRAPRKTFRVCAIADRVFQNLCRLPRHLERRRNRVERDAVWAHELDVERVVAREAEVHRGQG